MWLHDLHRMFHFHIRSNFMLWVGVICPVPWCAARILSVLQASPYWLLHGFWCHTTVSTSQKGSFPIPLPLLSNVNALSLQEEEWTLGFMAGLVWNCLDRLQHRIHTHLSNFAILPKHKHYHFYVKGRNLLFLCLHSHTLYNNLLK